MCENKTYKKNWEAWDLPHTSLHQLLSPREPGQFVCTLCKIKMSAFVHFRVKPHLLFYLFLRLWYNQHVNVFLLKEGKFFKNMLFIPVVDKFISAMKRVTNRWNRSHLSWIFSKLLTFTLHIFVLTQMYPSPTPMLIRAYFGALKWLQTQINIGKGKITQVFQDLWLGL